MAHMTPNDAAGLAFFIILAVLAVYGLGGLLRLILETILNVDFHHDDTEDIL